MAFSDIKPQAPVHVVIVPKHHIERISDAGAGDAHMLGDLMLTASAIAKKLGIESSGYRVVANCNADGGQEVMHLHLHLLGGRRMQWPPG